MQLKKTEIKEEPKKPRFTNNNVNLPPSKPRWKRLMFRYMDNIGEIIVVLALFFFVDKGVDYLYEFGIINQTSANQYISIQDIEKWLLAIMITVQTYNVIILIVQVKFKSLDDFIETDVHKQLFNQLTPWQKWLVFLWLFSCGIFAFSQILQGIA
jgi:hypothetical protein